MNWRTIGDVGEDTWQQVLAQHNSPIAAEGSAAYQAAQPHTRLCLAQMIWESQCGTQGIATNGGHNPLGLRPRGGDGFAMFGSWTAAIAFWLAKITDPTYAYKDTVTLEQYIHVYAPASDGNDEAAYVAHITQFAKEHPGVTTPAAAITFGRVPKPAMETHIVPKAGSGHGYYAVDKGARDIVGTCHHRTDGHDSPQSTYNLFALGGERADDALTDFVIGFDGDIWLLNEPWGTRSPWANGGSDGLEGDGPAFVQKFGVSAINDRLASIEHCGLAEQDALTGEQIASSIALTAWLHDQAKVEWSSFPIHQEYGVVTQMQHFEFATKPCPGSIFRSHTDEIQNGVRGLMKQHQTSAPTGEPTPPPKPVTPTPPKLPDGQTLDSLTKAFGRVTKHQKGKKDSKGGFTPAGAVSAAWMARGAKENVYPTAEDWWVLGGKGDVITFANNWVLFRINARAGWQWVI